MTKSSKQNASGRPLSPHLSIYKLSITMVMSIVHRITGAALFFGLAGLVLWLIALANGVASFNVAQSLLTSYIGILIAFGFSWALIHHMLGGIRHFIWDMGKGLEPKTRMQIAWSTLIGSVGLNIALWVIGAICFA